MHKITRSHHTMHSINAYTNTHMYNNVCVCVCESSASSEKVNLFLLVKLWSWCRCCCCCCCWWCLCDRINLLLLFHWCSTITGIQYRIWWCCCCCRNYNRCYNDKEKRMKIYLCDFNDFNDSDKRIQLKISRNNWKWFKTKIIERTKLSLHSSLSLYR